MGAFYNFFVLSAFLTSSLYGVSTATEYKDRIVKNSVSLVNRVVGKSMRLLLASADQESLLDDEREQILEEACEAFELKRKQIKLAWAADYLPFDHFSWGNTLFIHKKAWQEAERDQKIWVMWHEVAHIARHHYGMNQLIFGAGALAVEYILKNISLMTMLSYQDSSIVKFSLAGPGLIGIGFGYKTMLRCQELAATRCAAEMLCSGGHRDIVEMICARTIFASLQSPVERAAWCFPSWREEMHCLQAVLEQDDLNKRLNQITRSYLGAFE